MNNDCIIELIEKVDIQSNEYGEPIYNEKKKIIFAYKKSVKQSEFYQAAALGFKPEIVLSVNSFEYNNEEFCYLDNKKFKIYRAYTKSKTEETELYLTDIVGESNVTS